MASGERFPGSLRSPTLKPAQKNPRKPGARGAIEGGEMRGWETDWSHEGIRMIGPNQSSTDRAIDNLDHS